MGKRAGGNIILTGFSYTGKSSVGRAVAQRLGWDFVDTDEEIVAICGKPIPEIFAQDGEERFREVERRVLERACGKGNTVIATGGGAVLDASNRELMAESGMVICLEARTDTIYRRLMVDAKDTMNPVVRPLLAGTDPRERIESLKNFRQRYYALSDWTVHTDSLTIEEVCAEVVHGWEQVGSRPRASSSSLPSARGSDVSYPEAEGAAFVVRTATQSYPVFAGWGLLAELGRLMRHAGLAGSAYIISDDGIFPTYGRRVLSTLEDAAFAVDSFVVPRGEKSKSIEAVTRIYDWLVERRAERGHGIVALGGGVVGDLAGFVAATFLRGLPLVQVPTTLMAMADSSIGGKVGIDHPQGKNLIGSFYQPRLVVADLETLTTLPRRELISGWAEVIKHAMVLKPNLLEFLWDHFEGLVNLETEATAQAVVQSASAKAEVVSEDEREAGKRIILNYGHTIGHGLEVATGYERLWHGEAVAVGMIGAAMISRRLGLLSGEVVERQRALIQAFGLPTTCPGVDLASVLGAMELDKKVRDRAVRWVLLKDIGQPLIREDVPREVVVSVIAELLR